MQVGLFLLAAYAQTASASNSLFSKMQKESSQEKSSLRLFDPRVIADGYLMYYILSFGRPQLPKYGLVCKHFHVARQHWPGTVIQNAGLPYAGGANPSSMDWRLARLLAGCMKGRHNQIFVPRSTFFPVRPELVKYAVERVANDFSICPGDKILYFDHFGVFLCTHEHYKAFACLLSTVRLEFSSEMEWPALHMRHVPYKLAEVDPSSMLRIVNTVSLKLRVKIFTGILSTPMGEKLICKNLESTRNVDSVRAAFVAVGKSCLSPLAEFFIDSHDAFERNQELVEMLTDLLPDGDESECSESAYALLLNDIRFAPDSLSQKNVLSRIDLISSQSNKLEFYHEIGDPFKYAGADFNCSENCVSDIIIENAVGDALVAAMYSHRHNLFKELWRRNSKWTDELIMAIKDFPKALVECLSFEECMILLNQNLDPRDKLQIIRSNVDLFAEHKNALRRPQSATHLIIAMELYPAKKYKRLIQTSVARKFIGDEMLQEVLDYLVGIFDEPDKLDLFVFMLKQQIECFRCDHSSCTLFIPMPPRFRESKHLFRALLSDKISDKQLRMLTNSMKRKRFVIRPSLQCIYALLNDSLMAEAMSTKRGRLISSCISTEVLTGALGFDLNENQIVRLLEIFQVPIHESSFVCQDNVSVSAAYTWLNENARTFGDMTGSAMNPGFMAHFVYFASFTGILCNDPVRIMEYYKATKFMNRTNDAWAAAFNDINPLVGEYQFRSKDGFLLEPNPLCFRNFGWLHLWFLHDPNSFNKFAPNSVSKAFDPSPQVNVSTQHCSGIDELD